MASNSYNDVSSPNNSPATPPSIPRKLKTQSVTNVSRPEPVPVQPTPPPMEDDEGDDDPPPPPPPKKSNKNRESIDPPIEINNSSPRASAISDEYLPHTDSYIDLIDAVIPLSELMENIPRSSSILTERSHSAHEHNTSKNLLCEYDLNGRIQISENDHISPVLYRKRRSNRQNEVSDNDCTPPSSTSPVLPRKISPASVYDELAPPPPCLPRVKSSYSNESSPLNMSPALPKKPVTSMSSVGEASSNLSPYVLRKVLNNLSSTEGTPNSSPLSPRKVQLSMPSHDDIHQVDSSPIIPKKMPTYSQGDSMHPDGSPVIPKKKPVVPPPFGSTVTTDAVYVNDMESGGEDHINEGDQMNQTVSSEDVGVCELCFCKRLNSLTLSTLVFCATAVYIL